MYSIQSLRTDEAAAAVQTSHVPNKGQNPLHRFPRNKSVTSPQHKRQVRNKLARAKVRCVCGVVSFPKFHYNDLLATSPSTKKLREKCLMDFGISRSGARRTIMGYRIV